MIESSVDEIEEGEIIDKMEATVDSPSLIEQEPVTFSESNLEESDTNGGRCFNPDQEWNVR